MYSRRRRQEIFYIVVKYFRRKKHIIIINYNLDYFISIENKTENKQNSYNKYYYYCTQFLEL